MVYGVQVKACLRKQEVYIVHFIIPNWKKIESKLESYFGLSSHRKGIGLATLWFYDFIARLFVVWTGRKAKFALWRVRQHGQARLPIQTPQTNG